MRINVTEVAHLHDSEAGLRSVVRAHSQSRLLLSEPRGPALRHHLTPGRPAGRKGFKSCQRTADLCQD